MKPRVTACIRADGTFELLLNETGRDLLVEELQRLDRRWDHFHLDHFGGREDVGAIDIALSVVPYRHGDTVFEHGKVLLRPDDWDQKYFPHVLEPDV